MRCEQLIEDFLDAGWLNNQWSQNTIKTYKNELSSFRKWISSSRGKKLPNATFEDITDFLEIKSTGRVCTHNLRISVLRHFYRHLFQQCKIGRNPCIGLKSVIRQQDLPSVLSESQVQILLDMPDIGTQPGLRNKAILELLYATGIRVSELTLLELSNLFLPNRYLIVRAHTSKSNCDRIVPFGAIAAFWLTRYLEEVRPSQSRIQHALRVAVNLVFLGRSTAGGLSNRTCYEIVAFHARRASITQRVSPHTLRHSFATHLLNGGASLIVIQKLLGHKSAQTTQIYTHRAIARLHQVHARHHPRGELFANQALKKGRHYQLHHPNQPPDN